MMEYCEGELIMVISAMRRWCYDVKLWLKVEVLRENAINMFTDAGHDVQRQKLTSKSGCVCAEKFHTCKYICILYVSKGCDVR